MLPMHQHQVLLVGPVSDTRSTLCELIEEYGYSVRAAESGDEALADLRATADKPCLMLVDSEMTSVGKMAENLEADERLRGIPVVILGDVHPDAGPLLRGRLAVPKPLRVPRLLELIDLMDERCNGKSPNGPSDSPPNCRTDERGRVLH
jgi:CheY-like chemotaxis protein